MKTKTNFGAVPTGISFTFPGSKQVWYVAGDGRAFSFEADQNTKRYVTPKFDEVVFVIK